MKRILLLPLVLLASLIPLGTAEAAPAGPETNPIGTLGWLPPNSRESSDVPPGAERLVVIYDRSLDAEGKPANLLATGAFGLKILANTHEVRMVDHSPAVGSIDDAGGGPFTPVDEIFVGVEGDVRDGACSDVGTPAFSAAFSTARSFLHSGSAPYAPQSGPGACEVVSSSTPVSGGFQTVVTTYVPGFWIDIELPTGAAPATSAAFAPEGENLLHHEIWYAAVYDTEGESGEFFETSDAAGQSRSVGDPVGDQGGEDTPGR
jgi:hypothetical protein